MNSERLPDDEEQAIRLAGLKTGPWTSQAQPAREFLTPRAAVQDYVAGTWMLSLASMEGLLAKKDRARESSIANVLRNHWDDERGVDDPDEISIRESFDEALTYLQLLELAVESNYLTVDVILEEARKELSKLLWSRGARNFVRSYDYVSVGYLATRVGIDVGQPDVSPPHPDPDGAVCFATLLSGHRAWTEDDVLDEWLGFLDDYIEVDDEHDLFRTYLADGRPKMSGSGAWGEAKTQDRFTSLHEGATRFVYRLSGMMEPLDADMRARAGLLYAYWLAKFFGFELEERGYAQTGINWGDVIEGSLVPTLPDEATRKAYVESVRAKMVILEETWQAVHAIVSERKEVRLSKEKSTSPIWFRMAASVPEDVLRQNVGALCVIEVPGALDLPSATTRGVSITAGRPYAKDFARCVVASGRGEFDAKVQVVGADGRVRDRIVKVPLGKVEFQVKAVLSQLSLDKLDI